MIAKDAAVAALELIGVASEDETPEAYQITKAVEALSRMLHGWKAQGVDLGLTGDLGLSDTVPVDSMYDEGVIALLAVQVAPSNARPAPNPGHWWRTIKANYTTVDEATVDGALTWLPSQRLRFTAGLG